MAFRGYNQPDPMEVMLQEVQLKEHIRLHNDLTLKCFENCISVIYLFLCINLRAYLISISTYVSRSQSQIRRISHRSSRSHVHTRTLTLAHTHKRSLSRTRVRTFSIIFALADAHPHTHSHSPIFSKHTLSFAQMPALSPSSFLSFLSYTHMRESFDNSINIPCIISCVDLHA